DRYSKIKLFTRKPLRLEHPKVTEILCDLLDVDTYKDNFYGDDVFCCIGTTVKKTPDKELYKKIDLGIPVSAAKLCKINGIKTFVVMSSMGANVNSSIFYSRTKGEMEQVVLEQKIENTYILRPSMIGGKRNEFRIAEKISIVFMKVINPLFVGSFRKYRMIDPDIIANAMIEVANNKIDKQIILSDQIQELGKENN
ncbi:MAG: NAD(P)H-binding protein, partial [Planctomycetia bacterium]|nr:NAD(P)H-binding protein [Planctomycetia bacterium]